METSSPNSQSAQRRIALRQAEIQADNAGLRRTAQFTDGSRGDVAMRWNDVTRIAAFRRDVVTQPVCCVAVSDPANILVLDETMNGWPSLLAGLSTHIAGAIPFADWAAATTNDSADARWTILFSARK